METTINEFARVSRYTSVYQAQLRYVITADHCRRELRRKYDGSVVFISFMLLRMGAFGGIAEYQNL